MRAYAPDGQTLATASDDRTVRLWSPIDGQELCRFALTATPYALVFSADGRRLAAATLDGRATVWDVGDGQPLAQVSHDAAVPPLPYSPNGSDRAEAPGHHSPSAATGAISRPVAARDNTARVWDLGDGGREVSRVQYDGLVEAVAFSPDGGLLASGSTDGSLKLSEPDGGRVVARMSMDKNFPVYHIAFRPDGGALVAGGYQFNAKIFSVPSGQEIAHMPHSASVQTVAFSPDGRYAVTGGNDSSAHVWDATSGQEIMRMPLEDANDVYALAFSPDGEHLAVVSDDDRISVWMATKPWQVAGLSLGSVAYKATFSPDGRYLAAGSAAGLVRVWDAATGQELHSWQTRGAVYPVAVHLGQPRTLRRPATTGARTCGACRMGAEVARLPQGDVVFDLDLSPSGRLLATATQQGEVRVWDWKSGRLVATMRHDASVQNVRFSPDERYVASASLDGTARVWSLADSRELQRVRIPDDSQIYSMDMTLDGRYLATGELGKVRLWDVMSGQQIRLLSHDNLVNDLAFSRDGQLLASAGGRDGSIRVFAVPSGQEVAGMEHTLSANGVAFMPDGKSLANRQRRRHGARVGDRGASDNLLAQPCASVARNLTQAECGNSTWGASRTAAPSRRCRSPRPGVVPAPGPAVAPRPAPAVSPSPALPPPGVQ